MSTSDTPTEDAAAPELGVDAVRATRSLRNGLITLVLLVMLVVGLLLAVPGLHGVGRAVTHMDDEMLVLAVVLEVLSCLGYVVAFLQVFERAPIRFGARVALSELAFGAAVSLGGAGSAAVGAWLLVERGGPPGRVAERSVVLFLLTSAINVVTLTVVGFGLWLGLLPGPRNPLLSLLPGVIGAVVLAFFLALPRLVERGATAASAGQAEGRAGNHRGEHPRHARSAHPPGLADYSARSASSGSTSACSPRASRRRVTRRRWPRWCWRTRSPTSRT